MSYLKIHKSLNDFNINEIDRIYDVDVNNSCFSDKIPTLTFGADPCIILVIHNREMKCGCVAHITNAVFPPSAPDKEEEKRYKRVFNFITERRIELGSTGLDIWLGAGTGFNTKTFSCTDRLTKELTNAYFSNFIIHDYRTFTALRTEWNPGAILYFPRLSCLSIIAKQCQQPTDSGLRELQEKRKATPSRSWPIRWWDE